ncbi:DNA repair protein RAD51 homolog 3-like [Amphibalanus amphitrite]|uniref:DNA repair protein RAD51 homolog 3-like n=1 Tax=Amphibalanus amphitrite TaxID=1232801 RepID=UPI001C920B86|nr:DNA repair protein RAD51 homolog 3-like [Amphibalanus amphitrite]
MARQIYTLQEPDSTIQKLHRAGLVQVRDVLRLTPDQLAAEAHLSPSEAAGLQQRAGRRPALTQGRPRPPAGHVVTFSRRLDALLGGGLPLGRITELVAPPGGGKTQLCLQACVDAALPAELGGLSADSLLVDTEDSPVTERLHSLAAAAADHVRCAGSAAADPAACRAAADFSAESALRRVHVLRLSSAAELLLLPAVLTELLERRPLRLVCVDSVAAPWRYGEPVPRRAQELQWLAAQLRRLAARRGLAVVLTNQATTHLPAGGGAACLVPALGPGWRHCAALRLWLEPCGDIRLARLTKHPERADGTAPFQVLAVGVRDVCGDFDEPAGQSEDSEQEGEGEGPSGGDGDGPGTGQEEDGAGGAESEAKSQGEGTGHVEEEGHAVGGHVTERVSDVTATDVTPRTGDVSDCTASKRQRLI